MLVSHRGEESTTVVDRMMSQLPYIETCLNHVGGWFSKTLRDKKFDPRCRIKILEPPWLIDTLPPCEMDRQIGRLGCRRHRRVATVMREPWVMA